MTMSRRFAIASLAALLGLAAGCSISVDKAKNGDDKNVKIDTPIGGVHVSSNDMTAADVGLPVYPGAHSYWHEKDGDKAADIQASQAELLLAGMEACALRVEATETISAATDEDDNRFLECAAAAHAEYLITGNLRHYPGSYGATQIVNARGFMKTTGR